MKKERLIFDIVVEDTAYKKIWKTFEEWAKTLNQLRQDHQVMN